MPRVEWTDHAERDLEEIAWYVGEVDHRPRAARQNVLEIVEKCSLYAASPLMGEARPDLREDCRAFRHKRWVVIYVPISDGLAVVRVVDGARDYPSLF